MEDRHQRWDRPPKDQLKDMFSLHLGERRGMLILILVLVLLSSWVVYEQWFRPPPKADLAAIEREMEEWIARKREAERSDPADRKDKPETPELFEFDPNTIGRDEWEKLGLSGRQVDVIFNYKEKGGRFRSKQDVAKLYSISAEKYAELEPYILLPDSVPSPFDRRTNPDPDRNDHWPDRRSWNSDPPKTDRITSLDINLADTIELVQLKGIGPAFARGIVKYRDLLGGYVSLDQLHEVYVLRDKPEAVDRLKEVLFIQAEEVRRIPINTATAEELASHPYIPWKVANGLVNYRKHHGAFRSIEEIKGSMLVNDSIYDRIAPYLTISP